jgi:hypothetical protein
MAEPKSLNPWWASLRPETRRRLVSHPRQPVPTDLLPEVTEGQRTLDARWGPERSAPLGMHLPSKVVTFIEARAAELAAARRLVAAEGTGPTHRSEPDPQAAQQQSDAMAVVASYEQDGRHLPAQPGPS